MLIGRRLHRPADMMPSMASAGSEPQNHYYSTRTVPLLHMLQTIVVLWSAIYKVSVGGFMKVIPKVRASRPPAASTCGWDKLPMLAGCGHAIRLYQVVIDVLINGD